MVRSAGDQPETGPRGVAAQSSVRIREAISPGTSNRRSVIMVGNIPEARGPAIESAGPPKSLDFCDLRY